MSETNALARYLMAPLASKYTEIDCITVDKQEFKVQTCLYESALLLRVAGSARRWSSFSQERAAEELHAKSTLTTWKRIVSVM